MVNADPVGNADVRIPEEIALRERFLGEFFAPPEMSGLKRALDKQFALVAARRDDTRPWGPDNRARLKAVLLTGPVQHGKSTTAHQALAELQPCETVDGQRIWPKPIMSECSSIFSPSGFAEQLLHELGYPISRSLPSDQMYARVRRRLPMSMPTHIVIDEYNRSFTPSGVSEARLDKVRGEIQGQFRALMDSPTWPVALIFVSTDEILAELEKPYLHHVRERIDEVIRIEPMVQGSPEEIGRLHEALKTYADYAGVDVRIPAEDLIYHRIMHATDYARGLAMDLLQEAVVEAWRAGEPVQTRHFAERYRKHTGAAIEANPFAPGDWISCDPHKLLQAVASLKAPAESTKKSGRSK